MLWRVDKVGWQLIGIRLATVSSGLDKFAWRLFPGVDNSASEAGVVFKGILCTMLAWKERLGIDVTKARSLNDPYLLWNDDRVEWQSIGTWKARHSMAQFFPYSLGGYPSLDIPALNGGATVTNWLWGKITLCTYTWWDDFWCKHPCTLIFFDFRYMDM